MGHGPHAEIISTYFQHLKALLTGGLVLGDFTPRNLHLVTAKNLYLGLTSTFPPPKIIYKYEINWDPVWLRLQNPVLELLSRDILFMIIHNIVANKERVHRFNMINSPNCTDCGVIQDNVHLFCECVSVREAWFWLRQRMLDLLPATSGMTSNFEFLHLMFEASALENEVVWLLGVHVQLVWDLVMCKKKNLSQNSIKTECQSKYQDQLKSRRPVLNYMIGLFS